MAQENPHTHQRKTRDRRDGATRPAGEQQEKESGRCKKKTERESESERSERERGETSGGKESEARQKKDPRGHERSATSAWRTGNENKRKRERQREREREREQSKHKRRKEDQNCDLGGRGSRRNAA
jgi:hypothetical protein